MKMYEATSFMDLMESHCPCYPPESPFSQKIGPFSKTPPGSRSRREAANSGLDSTRRSVPDHELLRGIGTICSCTLELLAVGRTTRGRSSRLWLENVIKEC